LFFQVVERLEHVLDAFFTAGERAFSAGSDIKPLDDYGSNWGLRNRKDDCYAIYGIRKPVIAQVRSGC
jgi:enoyl-CoA hydratase